LAIAGGRVELDSTLEVDGRVELEEESMLDAHRPEGRFFCWVLAAFLVSVFLIWSGVCVPRAMAAPAMTTVSDVVYRADGSPASGVVLISWPAFTAADGTPVAAGSTSAALGGGGALQVALVSNVGAAPSGTYYTAVFQLEDVVRTEYWLVGTTSPATLASVRATPGTGVTSQVVSKQYVDSALAANKAYVDSAVVAAGSGSFVAKGGDTMTGPLTLAGDPTGSSQASTKHYVDTGLSVKANLIGGVVPATQLGSGSPDGTLCLKGDSSWGACGTSANAVSIQNTVVDVTPPSDGQVLTYQVSSGKYTPMSGGGIGGTPAVGMAVVGNGSSFTSQAKSAVDVRDYGVDCTGSAASDAALSNAVAAGKHAVVAQGCVMRMSTSKTYGVTLEFKQGGMLKPDTGVTITLTGNIVAGRQQIFANALPGQGKVDFTGNTGITEVYPEWWGANAPGVTSATNAQAIQAAVFGAFGLQNRTNGSNLNQWNKALSFCGTYAVSGEIQLYHVMGFNIYGCAKLASGLVQYSANQRIFDGQNIAYGTIRNLSFTSNATQTGGTGYGPLIDIDNDHTHGSDISPQNITFEDDTFGGNGITDVGVLISKHGGDAQGDNIRCINCYFSGFTGAGWQIGGNNTGRNVGRVYAYNAIKEQFKGGDCQGNPLYCIAAYAGSFEVDGMTTEDDSYGLGTQTGYDFYCESPMAECQVRNVRAESHKLAALGWGLIEHSTVQFSANQWYSASRNMSMAGQAVSAGTWPFSGTGQCGDGKYYQFTGSGTLGGLGATTASSATSTTITVTGASWTANAFSGQQACIVSGTGNGEYGVITGNTANTITFSAGLTTNYYQLPIVIPDSTSVFVVEPYWKGLTGAGPFTNGTAQFKHFDFNVISGAPNDGGCGNCMIVDVEAMGGQVNVGGAASLIDHLYVSRQDWAGSNGTQGFADGQNMLTAIRDVTVGGGPYGGVPDQAIPVGGENKWIPWGLYRNSGGNSFFSGVSFYPMGTKPICWEQGMPGGGQSTNDVCIGIRNDPYSLNSASRAVLGFMGTLGPATAWGTDKNGSINRVQGGLPTGAGTPGDIAFSTGNTGSSGSSVVDGTDRWKIVGSTGHIFAVADNTYDIGASGANRPRDLWLGRNLDIAGNVTVHGTCTGCGGSGGGSSPLTTKGDLYVYGTGNARLGVGADNSCLVADSTQALGLKWGACASGSGSGSFATLTGQPTDNASLASALNAKANDAAVVHTSGAETIGGDKTFSGNVTVAGAMTVSGAWQVESAGPIAAMTVATGDSKVGFDSDGKLKVSENSGAVTEVAKVSSNISGNAATATALATAPTKCPAGQAAIGVDAGGNALGCFSPSPSGVDVTSSGQVTATHLASALPVAQGGTGFTDTTYQGNTHVLAAVSGSFSSGNLRKTDANGNEVDAGVALPAPGLPYVPFPNYNNINQSSIFPTTTTYANVVGVVIPYTISTTKFAYRVGATADATSNVYAVALYSGSGTLLMHYSAPGSTFASPINTMKIPAWTIDSGTSTLQPGKYYLMFTSGCSASCATFTGTGSNVGTFYSYNQFPVTTAGVPPASITIAGYNESFGAQVLSMIFEP
jgi:hypothetical protein